jgi:hypothetical protein
VRRDRDAGHGPERVVGRHRLAALHVERRAGEMPGAHRIDQVGLDDVAAARDVDQVAAARHCRERLRIEQALRLHRQRQRADHDVARAEHRFERLGRGPAPAARLEADRAEQPHDDAAHRAGAEHRDPAAHRRDRTALPLALALLRFVERQRARVAQRHQHDELGDALGLLRIDDARHRHVLGEVLDQQLVDAGRDRADPAQLRHLRGDAARHLPAEDDVDLGQGRGVDVLAVLDQPMVRRERADRRRERRCRHRMREEEDVHRRSSRSQGLAGSASNPSWTRG